MKILKNIAIIPARGGSKRIPRKNIKDFLGKSIIAYSIEAALESQLFDEVMVSTDDAEIAEIAKKYGAIVPFFRSEEMSNDFATTYDVIHEVITQYRLMNIEFENTCCLYPTAPFIKGQMLKNAFDILKEQDVHGVFSIVKYSYPIQRSIYLDENLRINLNHEENLRKRSQDLSSNYHDAGQFYFYNTKAYLKCKSVFKLKSKPIILSELQVQDIDTETDWLLAELKYKILNMNNISSI